MKVLIDWSTIAYQQWWRLKSPDYKAVTGIELAEFARNCAIAMIQFQELFQGADMYLALDTNSWRYNYYEEYYKKNILTYESESLPDTYVISHDSLTYLIQKNEVGDFYRTKLSKDEIVELDLKDTEFWKILPELPSTIKSFAPAYKGHRMDSTWPFATPKSAWKQYSRGMAYNIANTIKGKAIEADGAEADDIAFAFVEKFASDDIVLVTTDSDWHQLYLRSMFVKIFNPLTNNFEVLEPKKVRRSLYTKIMSGDTSDDIHGLVLRNKATKLGKVGAEKKIDEVGLDNITAYLKKSTDKTALERNIKLILLGKAPDDIKKNIDKAFARPKRAKQYYAWTDYQLDSTDILKHRVAGKELRKLLIDNA